MPSHDELDIFPFVLIQSPLALHLADMRAGLHAEADRLAVERTLLAALHLLIHACLQRILARLEGMLALWESGQLPTPQPARPRAPSQPRLAPIARAAGPRVARLPLEYPRPASAEPESARPAPRANPNPVRTAIRVPIGATLAPVFQTPPPPAATPIDPPRSPATPQTLPTTHADFITLSENSVISRFPPTPRTP